ncbi:hypothetical protein ACHAW5_003149 [Stephanodiscus triporus]|uniref:SET domain-containing protein n=1 Tax=Stephanodiscus triporus TaxID=2934178 RepID=A0ABD3NRE6_9STRA
MAVIKPRIRRHHIHVLIVICLLRRRRNEAAARHCAVAAAPRDDRIFFTRHDRGAYLAAAGRGDDGARTGGRSDEGDDDPDDASRRRPDVDDADDPTGGCRRVAEGGRPGGGPSSYDDPVTCTTYLAPSSIPNSGLGMYTAVPYKRGEGFPYPEIGIMLNDFSSKDKLIAEYPWRSSLLSLGKHEAFYGECIVPGLGMLANSHLGLWNVNHLDEYEFQRWRDGTDARSFTDATTTKDPGRGAQSHHTNVRFFIKDDVRAGEELFVSYGEEWFEAREDKLGIVPHDDHYVEADELLREFSLGHGRAAADDDPPDDGRVAEYEILLSDALEKDRRLRAALPDDVRDVPAAAEMGAARFSARDSIRSLDWLAENGACLDNIVVGTSTLPQAGRGAFATRSIGKGMRITTTPVLTLEREDLYLWEIVDERTEGEEVEGGTDDAGEEIFEDLVGHQLLLNYCYGHVNSSLLFYPYAPSVNFINHGGVRESNAEIRWSTYPYHKSDWLDSTLEEMKDRKRTGLMFDIIATRDLRRGEEILLYYGKDWEESWIRHVKGWMDPEGGLVDDTDDRPRFNMTDRLGLPTITDFNMVEKYPIVRTMEEQMEDPYPPHVMTVCCFDPPEDCVASTKTSHGRCRSRWKKTYKALLVFPCTIMSRQSIGGMDWYSALGGESEDKTHLVEYMPRTAVIFTDRPYTKDQYARGVFRHEVGLPDGMVPPHWMDLNDSRTLNGDS